MAIRSPIGYKVQCPKCSGVYPIVEGVMTTTLFGRGVAVAGMKTACGAVLIPSQFTDTVDWAGGGSAGALGAVAAALALGAAQKLASALDDQESSDKKITCMYWTYGPVETPVSDVSRHYVDLNCTS